MSNNQVEIKKSIFSFLNASRHVITALSLENAIQNQIKSQGINPKEYFEKTQNDPDTIALQNFNKLIEACTVYCKSIELSNSINVIVVDQWGDFLRIWHTQGDPQIFVSIAIDPKNKLFLNIQSFFDGNKCFQYRNERPLTEEEMKKFGLKK